MAEGCISNIEDKMEAIENTITMTEKQQKKLWDKLQDFKNRSRCQNIRIIGVPERAEEGNKNTSTFTVKMFKYIFNMQGEPDMEIERAHHSLASRPQAGQRPQPPTARFLRFPDKEKIMRLSREKGKLQWGGHKNHDLSGSIMGACRKKENV
ncbi:UNVERIFIED_CONTAM: hypothetical protein FKN15_028953 [Acipenser sinensis]